MAPHTPEAEARQKIDHQLEAAGWAVQDVKAINLHAQLGVAVREFPTATGPADYMLFADGKAIGIVEAKKVGETLSAVHEQASRYASSDTKHIQLWEEPLPFTYETTGVETLFTDERDPDARARRVFCFHRPEELIARVKEPTTLRARLKTFPELVTAPLRECQIDAVSSLEKSLSENRPKALIQMATGSGKTYTAVTTAYRLIKHAEEIVNTVRLEFAKGNDFCQKITYRAGAKPEDLIKAFRTAPEFRIAVTVDMIATGTDIKPLECLLFMRDVRSQLYFEQMKGHGTRTIDPTDFQSVTPDGGNKTHFVLVDAVGVTESDKTDSRPLERKPTVAFDKLLLSIAMGARDPDTLASAANRLARLDQNLTETDREQIRELTGGPSVKQLASQLLSATDPDTIAAHAEQLANEAAQPIAANPTLREFLDKKRRDTEMTIDHASVDTVLSAAYDTEKAEQLIQTWTQFIEANKDELTALQIIYNRPHKDRHLTYGHIKQLAAAVSKPPYNIAPEEVWRAYDNLEGRKPTDNPVRVLTNLITLVRHSIQPDTVPLVPYGQIDDQRFDQWLAQQSRSGVPPLATDEGKRQDAASTPFSEEHLDWLHMIKDHIATSAAIEPDDFQDVPFNQRGGLAKARKLFGSELKEIIDNLNEVLVGYT